MGYASFLRAVKSACGHQCEVPLPDGGRCDASAETVHHFLKRSTWPQYVEDPDNGMGCCGPCHTEIERRLRERGDVLELYPMGRYRAMLEKAGVEGVAL
jgi:hypothetical protein